jgi:PEGA domain
MRLSNVLTPAVVIALALGVMPASAQHRGGGGHVSRTSVARAGAVPRGMAPYYAFRRRASLGGGLWVGYPIAYPYGLLPSPYVAPYPYPTLPQGPGPADQYPSPAPPGGQLELHLEPSAAQVHIDGYYVGIVWDFDRPGGLAVEAGPHHIEIRAPGYQTSAFEVKLLPDQPVTYREDLRPVSGGEPERGASARSSAVRATTFYVISGCYLGNVPPTEVALPPGCDPGQAKTFDPRK